MYSHILRKLKSILVYVQISAKLMTFRLSRSDPLPPKYDLYYSLKNGHILAYCKEYVLYILYITHPLAALSFVSLFTLKN